MCGPPVGHSVAAERRPRLQRNWHVATLDPREINLPDKTAKRAPFAMVRQFGMKCVE